MSTSPSDKNTLYIGVIGPNGSGKSTVCQHLIEAGFQSISLSDFVREEAQKLVRGLDRDSLTETANQLKAQHGQDFLAKAAIAKAKTLNTPKIVFDSIRNPTETQVLKAAGCYLISITAPVENRFQRIENRQKDTDKIDFNTFQKQDTYESQGQSSGQHIEAAQTLCDTHIENTGTLDELKEKVNQILSTRLNETASCQESK